MSDYKIFSRADGAVLNHYVHRALGPWPFKNWSWSPVFSSSSHAACVQWIVDTEFAESPEGQRLALQREEAAARQKKVWEKERLELAKEGWLWSEPRMMFVHRKTGESRLRSAR